MLAFSNFYLRRLQASYVALGDVMESRFLECPRMRASKLQHRGPRTISEALYAASQKAGFSDVGPADIHVSQLRLPAGDVVFLTRLFVPLIEQNIWLETSKRFQAKWQNCAVSDSTDKLDGAKVKADGSVHLTDGRIVVAIDVIPLPLPYELSDLEWVIVKTLIAFLGAERFSLRSLREGIPNRLKRGMPTKSHVDFARLARLGDPEFRKAHGIRLPYLKEIAGRIQSQFGHKVSEQTIANALEKVGIRLPARRKSRVRARS